MLHSDPLSLPSPLPFLARPLVARVVAAFDAAGQPVRFVGGCVRDTLLQQATHRMDVDMATHVLPDAVMTLLSAAGLTAKPTGIAFGTVTVFMKDDAGETDKVEITTLRQDLSGDGRHAVVQFGTDWEEDSRRRDFTMNALYADANGTLYDYHNGLADLQAGTVRFIGAPLDRIREDYLRIMRFFRFHARFGTGEPDPEALGACAALKGEMGALSAERIWDEFGKLLVLPLPHKGVGPMALCGVLDKLFPYAYDIDRLENYAAAESHNDFPAVPVLRLAALFPDLSDQQRSQLAAQLKLSRKESDWLDLTAESLTASTPGALARAWYWNQDVIAKSRQWLINLAFLYGAVHSPVNIDHIVTYAAGWEAPVFPLAGADMIALGVESGPRMGEVLTAVEKYWAGENFIPTRDECLAKAQAIVNGEE